MSEKPTKGFGFAAMASKSRMGDHLRRAVAALEALDDVNLGVGEEGVEVGGAVTGVPGDEVVTREDVLGQLDLVALRLPPLHAAEDVGAALVRAGRRGDADRAAVRERLAEEVGRDQKV